LTVLQSRVIRTAFSAGNFAEISSIRGALGFACFLQKLPIGFSFLSTFFFDPDSERKKCIRAKKGYFRPNEKGHELLTHGPICKPLND